MAVNKMGHVTPTYKVLVVDQRPTALYSSRLALSKMSFAGKSFTAIEACSLEEAKKRLLDHEGVAMVILNSEIEGQDISVSIIDFIRNELKNESIRIIIRTGYPNSSLKRSITENYKIDGYLFEEEIEKSQFEFVVINAIHTYNQIQKAIQYLHTNALIENVISGNEAIREKFSDTIHEGVAQNIAGVRLFLQSIKMNNRTHLDTKYVEMLEKSEQVLRSSIMELKDICFDLMPRVSTTGKLSDLLYELGVRLKRDKGVILENDITEPPVAIESSEKLIIYRIIQEWIDYTVKWGDVSSIACRVRPKDNSVEIFIETDDLTNKNNDAQTKELNLILAKIELFKGELNGAVSNPYHRLNFVMPLGI